jgi:hypothetical protein
MVNNGIYVAATSRSGSAPIVPLFSQASVAISDLLNQGFVLSATTGSTFGPCFTLIRTQSTSNPDQTFFAGKVGQTLTVHTGGGDVTGTVVLAGVDFVEIVENTGNIVMIPYTSIVSVG